MGVLPRLGRAGLARGLHSSRAWVGVLPRLGRAGLARGLQDCCAGGRERALGSGFDPPTLTEAVWAKCSGLDWQDLHPEGAETPGISPGRKEEHTC